MYLSQLHLEEFRVYRELDRDFPSAGARIVGPNGSGKSTVLEAISLLSTARSYRTGADRELIRWGSGEAYGFPPYARSRGDLAGGPNGALEIVLEGAPDGSASASAPAGITRKRFLADGRPVRAVDFVGRLRTVSFNPEDVGIISGSPGNRRRFLDIAISQLNRDYLRALSRYNRVVAQRNSLLKSLARSGASAASPATRTQLAFWDDELVEAGSLVTGERARRVQEMATHAHERFAELTGGAGLDLTYLSTVLGDEAAPDDSDVAGLSDPPGVAGRFRYLLEERLPEELRRGMTVVGPHRDDVALTVDGVDLATYGSRGQQRLGILALKLAEADTMISAGAGAPILLLDDVLSELDPQRSELLINTVARYGSQVFVTATERAAIESGALAGLPIFRAGNETLRPE